MIIAKEEAEIDALDTLFARGIENGVKGLYIVEGDEARKREPSLSPDVKAALLSPTDAICDPYEVALRALENDLFLQLKCNGSEPGRPTAC